MELVGKEKVTYLGCEVKESRKTGKPFTLVSFGDTASFQRLEFFKPENLDLSNIEQNTDVMVEFDVKRVGYETKLNLLNVSEALPY